MSFPNEPQRERESCRFCGDPLPQDEGEAVNGRWCNCAHRDGGQEAELNQTGSAASDIAGAPQDSGAGATTTTEMPQDAVAVAEAAVVAAACVAYNLIVAGAVTIVHADTSPPSSLDAVASESTTYPPPAPPPSPRTPSLGSPSATGNVTDHVHNIIERVVEELHRQQEQLPPPASLPSNLLTPNLSSVSSGRFFEPLVGNTSPVSSMDLPSSNPPSLTNDESAASSPEPQTP